MQWGGGGVCVREKVCAVFLHHIYNKINLYPDLKCQKKICIISRSFKTYIELFNVK